MQGERDGDSPLPCGYCPPKGSDSESLEVLVIRPSTMWFTAEPSRLQELVVSPASGRGLHRVCYSFHSSYSELRDLVSLLRPRRVYPNVLPASDLEWGQVCSVHCFRISCFFLVLILTASALVCVCVHVYMYVCVCTYVCVCVCVCVCLHAYADVQPQQFIVYCQCIFFVFVHSQHFTVKFLCCNLSEIGSFIHLNLNYTN